MELLESKLDERDEAIAAKERRVAELQGLLQQVDTLNGQIEEGQSQLKLARADFVRLQGAYMHDCLYTRVHCCCAQ